MKVRSALSAAFSAAALLVLAGCGTPAAPGGSDDPAVSGPAGGDSGGGVSALASCLEGRWDLDEADSVRQIAELMSSNGANVVDSGASGGVELLVESGTMTYISDVTYSVTIDSGLVMRIDQTQTGRSSGAWTVDGDTIVFSDWTDGLEFSNKVTVGGETSALEMDLPTEEPGVPLEVTCSGDTLQTHPQGGQFTSTWTRI